MSKNSPRTCLRSVTDISIPFFNRNLSSVSGRKLPELTSNEDFLFSSRISDLTVYPACLSTIHRSKSPRIRLDRYSSIILVLRCPGAILQESPSRLFGRGFISCRPRSVPGPLRSSTLGSPFVKSAIEAGKASVTCIWLVLHVGPQSSTLEVTSSSTLLGCTRLKPGQSVGCKVFKILDPIVPVK